MWKNRLFSDFYMQYVPLATGGQESNAMHHNDAFEIQRGVSCFVRTFGLYLARSARVLFTQISIQADYVWKIPDLILLLVLLSSAEHLFGLSVQTRLVDFGAATLLFCDWWFKLCTWTWIGPDGWLFACWNVKCEGGKWPNFDVKCLTSHIQESAGTVLLLLSVSLHTRLYFKVIILQSADMDDGQFCKS